MRLVEVEWIDSVSHCDSPWRTREELGKSTEPSTCFSAGWVFHEDDESLTLLMSHNGDEEVGMALTIPKVAIKKEHKLGRQYDPVVLT